MWGEPTDDETGKLPWGVPIGVRVENRSGVCPLGQCTEVSFEGVCPLG